MKKTIQGYIDFFVGFFGVLSLVVVVMLSAFLLAFLILVKCLIATACLVVFNIVKSAGFVLSIRAGRRIVRVLRRVPMRKIWRGVNKAERPVSTKPFAINFHEVDPFCFIGMKSSEISTILQASDYKEWGGDRGDTYLTWRRVGFEVQCSFDGGICSDCSFYTVNERGWLTEISRTI